MQLSYKALMLLTITTFLAMPSYSMNQSNDKKCKIFCCKKGNADNDFILFLDDDQKGCFSKLKNKLCIRQKNQVDPDPEQGIPTVLLDNEKEIAKCCGMPIERWKKIGCNSAEITTKLLISLFSLKTLGDNELTFFAQHHASDAIGKHIKFEKWKPFLYPLSIATLYGASIGIKFFDGDVSEFYTGFQIVAGLTIYKVINNFFDGLNRGQKPNVNELIARIENLENKYNVNFQ